MTRNAPDDFLVRIGRMIAAQALARAIPIVSLGRLGCSADGVMPLDPGIGQLAQPSCGLDGEGEGLGLAARRIDR